MRHEPGEHREVAAVTPERPAHRLPVRAARARAEQCGPPGQRSGRHGVVDALPGERVDQRRRVTGQQHPPVGMVAPARSTAGGGAPRTSPGRAAARAAGRRRAASSSRRDPPPRRSNTPYPTLARPPASGERPRVRGVARRARTRSPARRGRTWSGRSPGSRRRRRAAVRPGAPISRRTTEFAPSAPITTRGGDTRRRARRGRAPPAATAPGGGAAARPAATAASTSRASKTARGIGWLGRAQRRATTWPPGLRSPQPRHGGPERAQVRHAQRVEQVEHVGGHPVPAGLVPGERRGVEQQHPGVGAQLQHAQGGRRARRPGAHHGDVDDLLAARVRSTRRAIRRRRLPAAPARAARCGRVPRRPDRCAGSTCGPSVPARPAVRRSPGRASRPRRAAGTRAPAASADRTRRTHD